MKKLILLLLLTLSFCAYSQVRVDENGDLRGRGHIWLFPYEGIGKAQTSLFISI